MAAAASKACCAANSHMKVLALAAVLVIAQLTISTQASSLGRRLQQNDDWLWNQSSNSMGSLRQNGTIFRAMPPSPPAAPPPPAPLPAAQFTYTQDSEPYNMGDSAWVAVPAGNWTADALQYWAVTRTVNPVYNFVQAAVPAADGTLLLTESIVGDQAITAVFDIPFDLTAGFTAHFVFRVDNSNGTIDRLNSAVGGEGLTFALFPAIPSTNGAGGQYLGFGGLNNSFAVELDWRNNGLLYPSRNDAANTKNADGSIGTPGPDQNHIGININGDVVSLKTVHINAPMANAQDKSVWVVYSGDGSRTLQVFFNDVGYNMPLYPVLTYDADSLSTILGSATNQAYMGFTASSSAQAMGDIAIVALNITRVPIVPIAPSFPQFVNVPSEDEWSLKKPAKTLKLDPLVGDLDTEFALSSQNIRPSQAGMRLTSKSRKNAGPQSGVATLLESLDCSVGCAVEFAYVIDNDNNDTIDQDLQYGGDGLSLIFLPSDAYISEDNRPGALGYGGLNGTVAIEFDTFYTAGVDPENPVNADNSVQYIGPDGDHIGVNIDGSLQSLATWHATTSLNSPGAKNVWVEYINESKTLKVFYNPFSPFKPSIPVLQYQFDLIGFFGSSEVYPAFGAGYSTAVSDHYIKNATFKSYDKASSGGLLPGPVGSLGVDFKSFTPSAMLLWNTSGLIRTPPKDPPIVAPNAQGVLPLSTYSRQPLGNIAILTKSLDLTYGFNVFFSFIIEETNYTAEERAKLGSFQDADPADVSTGGEGFTFVLVNSPSVLPGEPNGGLGYRGIPNSLAVEFDTYYNLWDPRGEASALNGNHIGIDWDGDMTSKLVTPLAGRIDNGQTKFVWIEYSAREKLLRVFYSNASDQPVDPVLQQVGVNITDLLKSNMGYIGFSGESTTNAWVQKILSLKVELKNKDSISLIVPTRPAPPPPPVRTRSSSDDSKLAGWAIFLIVLAVLVFLALLGVCVFCIWRQTSKNNKKEDAVVASPTIVTVPTKEAYDGARGPRSAQRSLTFAPPPPPMDADLRSSRFEPLPSQPAAYARDGRAAEMHSSAASYPGMRGSTQIARSPATTRTIPESAAPVNARSSPSPARVIPTTSPFREVDLPTRQDQDRGREGRQDKSPASRNLIDIPKHLRVSTKKREKTPTPDRASRTITSPERSGRAGPSGVASPPGPAPWILNPTFRPKDKSENRFMGRSSDATRSSKESKDTEASGEAPKGILARMFEGQKRPSSGAGGPSDFRVEA